MKRVSYDYVDGSQNISGSKYPHKKQTLYSSSNQHRHHTYADTFDEHEEQTYEQYPPPVPPPHDHHHHQHHYSQQQPHPHPHPQPQHEIVLTPNHVHSELSMNQMHASGDMMMMDDDDGDGSTSHDDYSAYLNKWWTVKFPRRSSKVGLFHSNSKTQKARIVFDANKCLVFECDQQNMSTRLAVHELKACDVSEKKNVCIYTRNGSKYKIKCDFEKEANFWYRVLNEFMSSN